MTSIYRYPNAPSDFSKEQERVWNLLISILRQRDKNDLFGNSNSISLTNLQDGVAGKGFTKVTEGPYYVKPTDGTLICYTSKGVTDIYLTSAVDSENAFKIIKKADNTGNSVIVRDASGALIDSTFAVTISNQWNALMVGCDGTTWYVLSLA